MSNEPRNLMRMRRLKAKGEPSDDSSGQCCQSAVP